MRWPIGIGFGMFLVVCVNFAFWWIASHGAEPVTASYSEEHR